MSHGENGFADQDPLAFLAGGGEMGRLIRAFDWSNTPVGPAAEWPKSLLVAIRIMIDSRYAMWLGWGPEFTFFYNDAYARMSLGPKHRWALGQPARAVWPEIWADIGPRAESVIRTGQATWDEGLLLFLERQGFSEETYHTFSYSPIPDDRGVVGGMLCVVTEETERTIGERRLRTLRELAARTTEEAKSAEDACETAARTLADNPQDLPFALVYLLDEPGNAARLVGATGLPAGSRAAPASIDLTGATKDREGWPLRNVLASGRAEVITGLEQRFGQLRCGPWPEPLQQAVIVPLAKPGQVRPTGFVVAGVSPRLAFSEGYKGFFELLAGHVATALSNARAYEEERRRAEQLAELDRAKTAFFSNVSHEFRTPLTLMLGPVEELLARSHTDLPPAASGQLEVVNRNGLRLLRLVNSLLDFSRIEAGRVRATFQPTELAAFTADLASNFRSACERAGLTLTVDCPPLGEPVFVDREMWEKIVLNLISNAFKFTFDGEIAIAVRRSGTAIELQVRDTGTGIPAEEMPRLFERFHRIENARGRTHEGSGIGLALVQELVKLHGGSIAAESELDKGTTFTVTVPLGSAHLPPDQIGDGRTAAPTGTGASPFVEEALRWLPDDERARQRSELPTYSEPLPTPHCWAEQGKDDARPRVLVADDNADMRQYVARLLAEQFRVEVAPDGEVALALAKDRPPDLILTDVMMPKLSGFGLLQELRADPRTRGLPVIMLSARAGEESRVEGMEAGADDYLVKPFSARELLARVTAHLQMARLRRESERAVRESEERFRALVNATSDVVYCMNVDWSEMRFLQGQDFIADTQEPSRTWLETYIPPDGRGHVMEVIQQAVRTRTVFQLEHRVVRADGSLGWTFSRAVPLFDAGGEIVEWFGAATDVTARRRAEERLRESEERMRVTLSSIGDAVITTDTNGHVTFMNGVAESLTGWINADAVGQPLEVVFQIVNEQSRQPVESPASRALQKGVVVGLANHTVLIKKDGTALPIDDSAAPIKDGQGRVMGCVLVFRDVSERRRVENESRRNQELLRLVHQIGKIGHWEWDLVTGENKWSPELETLYGLKPGTFEGTYDAWTRLVHPADLANAEKDVRRALETGRYLTEFRVTWPDGSIHWLEARANVFKDADGRAVRITGVNMDITDRKLQEDALREADRKKDEFLATLAHELRNPLAAIGNAAAVAHQAPGDEASGRWALDVVGRQWRQLAHLVDDLLDISRINMGKIELRRDVVDARTAIERAVESVRPQIIAKGLSLDVVLGDRFLPVDADPTRLEQIIVNLLGNAAKYTDDAGRITITASAEGAEVALRVEDTGIGIAPQDLHRIFEPFGQVDNSLARSQGGLGIGLTLVRRLVELHGGRVGAESDGLGKGSTFIVHLPLSPHAVIDRPTQAPLRGLGKSTTRVLIVDDNVDAVLGLARFLRRQGFEVATAHDGSSALDTIDGTPPTFALLDIGLPGMDGYQLASCIRERYGNRISLYALSGYGRDDDRERAADASFDGYLLKPVDLDKLLTLLAS